MNIKIFCYDKMKDEYPHEVSIMDQAPAFFIPWEGNIYITSELLTYCMDDICKIIQHEHLHDILLMEVGPEACSHLDIIHKDIDL